MNLLEAYLTNSAALSENQAMDLLQENGVISDNCVVAMDVADVDCQRAVKWLKMQGAADLIFGQASTFS